MALTGVARRLTAAERARAPKHQHLVAYYDGYGQAAYPGVKPQTYARRLTPAEARFWRDGWAEGYRERTCHAAHGFNPCPGLPHTKTRATTGPSTTTPDTTRGETP